jgi:hypothetical protein
MSRLLDNLFARPSLNVILGPLGSKKTWLALDLAASVASGRGWLGFRGPQSPSLFVDKALGASALQHRVRSLLSARGSSINFPFYFYSNFTPLTDPQEYDFLLSQSRVLNLGLIVIDSLFFLSLHLNRHKLHALFPILENLRNLALAANAAVLLIHDLSKHRTDLAAPLLDMGVDHVLATESLEQNPVIHLRTLASRNQQSISILTQPGSMTFKPGSRFYPTPSTLGLVGRKVLAFLRSVDSAPTQHIIASVSADPGRVSNVIQEMLMDGYIRRTNPGGRGTRALYQLTPAGRQLA